MADDSRDALDGSTTPRYRHRWVGNPAKLVGFPEYAMNCAMGQTYVTLANFLRFSEHLAPFGGSNTV